MQCQLIALFFFPFLSSLAFPSPGNVRCISHSIISLSLLAILTYILPFLGSLSPPSFSSHPLSSFASPWLVECDAVHGDIVCKLPTLFFMAMSGACSTYARLLLGMWYFYPVLPRHLSQH